MLPQRTVKIRILFGLTKRNGTRATFAKNMCKPW